MRLRITYGDKVIGLFPYWNTATIQCDHHLMDGDITIVGLVPSEGLDYEVADTSAVCTARSGNPTSVEFAKWFRSVPVTMINRSLFAGCTSLTDVTIPWTIETIGDSAFAACPELSMVVFEKNSNLTWINQGAFANCYKLRSIVIPSKVTRLSGGVFENCRALWSISLPKSLESIGQSAFSGCENLESITFRGTVTQWSAITKGEYWNYGVPATKVICTDGEVAL